MSEIKPKIVHYTEVPAVEIGETAPGAKMRWLINKENDGAPVYAMRMVELDPKGSSPRHTHPYEHENYILEGVGRVFIIDQWYDLKPGDVVLVPPGVLHQYVNAGDSVFKFLCSIPV